MNGDTFLSKTQSFLTTAATPIISIWQNINEEKDKITIGELLHCMEQSSFSKAQHLIASPAFTDIGLKTVFHLNLLS